MFLKFAGRNEFNVPVYFENGIEIPPKDCGLIYPTPYLLPDSIWHSVGMDRGAANVLVFSNERMDIGKFKSGIDDEFGSGVVRIDEGHTLFTDSARYEKWRNCIFLMSDPCQIVLFDEVGRIRGYYDPRLRDEQDRLRVELKILLKKY